MLFHLHYAILESLFSLLFIKYLFIEYLIFELLVVGTVCFFLIKSGIMRLSSIMGIQLKLIF